MTYQKIWFKSTLKNRNTFVLIFRCCNQGQGNLACLKRVYPGHTRFWQKNFCNCSCFLYSFSLKMALNFDLKSTLWLSSQSPRCSRSLRVLGTLERPLSRRNVSLRKTFNVCMCILRNSAIVYGNNIAVSCRILQSNIYQSRDRSLPLQSCQLWL